MLELQPPDVVNGNRDLTAIFPEIVEYEHQALI